jgi:hypothetical protein
LEEEMSSEVAMKGNRRKFVARVLCGACALGIFAASGGAAWAQDVAAAAGPSAPDVMYERAGRGPMPPDAIEFVGFQAGLSDKVVTGAPFSTTITTVSTQTLADGNQIQHTSSGSLARDSQGRTRRDMTMPAFGPWAESGKPSPHVAAVNDPVTNTRYVLDTDNKTARKMIVPPGEWGATRKHLESAGGRDADNETVTTSLGAQTVGGVSAEGTRYTRTIPAGQIGNTKPIVIITERWYSPDLQMVVMTKHTDPRMGETSFQMTNIVRQEPAASLFQVPADYTVKQGGEGQRVHHGGDRPETALPPPPIEQ